ACQLVATNLQRFHGAIHCIVAEPPSGAQTFSKPHNPRKRIHDTELPRSCRRCYQQPAIVGTEIQSRVKRSVTLVVLHTVAGLGCLAVSAPTLALNRDMRVLSTHSIVRSLDRCFSRQRRLGTKLPRLLLFTRTTAAIRDFPGRSLLVV